MHCDHVLLATLVALLTMLGSADMQIYGDPCVARKGKSVSPIYRAFSRVISGMKKREASTRNLHVVKNVNES